MSEESELEAQLVGNMSIRVESADNPEDHLALVEARVIELLGFRIRPSGNISGKYTCDIIRDGKVFASGPAHDREIGLWRFAVGHAAGYSAAASALDALNKDRQKLTDKIIKLEEKL